jgi:hypothetical protein
MANVILKAISFSDLTFNDYVRLGVDCSTAPPRKLSEEMILGLVVDEIESQNPSGSVRNNTSAGKGKARMVKFEGAWERTEFTIHHASEEFPRRSLRTLVLGIEQASASSDDEVRRVLFRTSS